MYTITQPVPVMQDKVFWQKPKIREIAPVQSLITIILLLVKVAAWMKHMNDLCKCASTAVSTYAFHLLLKKQNRAI